MLSLCRSDVSVSKTLIRGLEKLSKNIIRPKWSRCIEAYLINIIYISHYVSDFSFLSMRDDLRLSHQVRIIYADYPDDVLLYGS